MDFTNMSKVGAKVLSPATKNLPNIDVHMHANSTHTIFVYMACTHTATLHTRITYMHATHTTHKHHTHTTHTNTHHFSY